MRSRILLACVLSALSVGTAFALFRPLGSDGSHDRPSGRRPAQSDGVVASAESGASDAPAAAGTNAAEALSYVFLTTAVPYGEALPPRYSDRPGERLGPLGSMYASPVGAADRVYVTDLQGSTAVITHSKGPEILAVNRLDDAISASAAVAGRELFLRGAVPLLPRRTGGER